jgi:hypothetical protein
MAASRRFVSVMSGLILGAAVAFGTVGCESKGPAERAGEKLDKAADKVSDAIHPKGPVEKAGRAVDRAVDDAKD